MRIRLTGVIIILFLGACSCKNKAPGFSNFSGFAQGTTYHIVFENSDKITLNNLRTEVDKILHDFDMSLSLYQDSSILSRINRNENVKPDSFFVEAFNLSKEISKMSDGAFDITVGPLVEAWGFGPDDRKSFTE
jgi:thiamine biosynthesis lipoprotein